MATTAHVLDPIIPKVLSRSLLALRSRLVGPRVLQRETDIGVSPASKGDVITVELPPTVTVKDVTPAETPPSPETLDPPTVTVTVDQHKHADFQLSDKDLNEIDRNSQFVPGAMSSAVEEIARVVNAFCLDHLMETPNYRIGTTATESIFGPTAGFTDILNLRQDLSTQKAPVGGRFCLVDFAQSTNLLSLSQVRDMNLTGDSGPSIQGEIGRKAGFNWIEDDQVPTHTFGALTGTIVTSGAAVLGATSVLLATGAGEAIDLNRGDVITFAGDSQNYTVLADLNVGASSTGTVTIRPGLAVAQAGGEAVTLVRDGGTASATALAMHPRAGVFVSRPLADSIRGLPAAGASIFTARDPVSGLAMRVEVMRQYKQTVWDLDMLYGARLLREELCVKGWDNT